MKGLVDSMGGTVAGNGTQAHRTAFWDEAHQYAVAPVICYESIYGEYCTEYIHDGAHAIFILTNDGWWDDSPGFRQHLKFASLRAIETRRSIARVTFLHPPVWICRCDLLSCFIVVGTTGSTGYTVRCARFMEVLDYSYCGVEKNEVDYAWVEIRCSASLAIGIWNRILFYVFMAILVNPCTIPKK